MRKTSWSASSRTAISAALCVDNARLVEMRAGDIMTKRPIVIDPSTLAAQALLIMEQRKITSLVVGGTRPDASPACSTSTTSGGQSCFERLLPIPRRARRASHRTDGRESVGALQTASRTADRSPPRSRIAPLHRRPELPRHQPDRSRHRGAEQGRGESRRRARNSSAAWAVCIARRGRLRAPSTFIRACCSARG